MVSHLVDFGEEAKCQYCTIHTDATDAEWLRGVVILIVGTLIFKKSTKFGVEKSCITFGQNAFKKISKSVLMQTSPFSLSPSWKKPTVQTSLKIFVDVRSTCLRYLQCPPISRAFQRTNSRDHTTHRNKMVQEKRKRETWGTFWISLLYALILK